MKLLNGKWAFALGGAVLGAAIVAGIQFYGKECGLFAALTDTGNFIGDELASGGAKSGLALDETVAILLGILVGAPIGVLATGSFKFSWSDDGGFFASLIRNLIGGFLVMTGVLIATESLWGHCSGAATLAGGSWIFLGAMSAAGVLASLLFGGKASGSAKAEKPAKKGATK